MTTNTRPYKFISESDTGGFIVSLVNDPFGGISVELSDFQLEDDQLKFNFSLIDDVDESLYKELTSEIEKTVLYIINDSINNLKET
jgi:hypothetical protein